MDWLCLLGLYWQKTGAYTRYPQQVPCGGVLSEGLEGSQTGVTSKGKQTTREPSSYKPICLINTIYQLFERIIKKRLEVHLEQTGGTSNHQFGFTKG